MLVFQKVLVAFGISILIATFFLANRDCHPKLNSLPIYHEANKTQETNKTQQETNKTQQDTNKPQDIFETQLVTNASQALKKTLNYGRAELNGPRSGLRVKDNKLVPQSRKDISEGLYSSTFEIHDHFATTFYNVVLRDEKLIMYGVPKSHSDRWQPLLRKVPRCCPPSAVDAPHVEYTEELLNSSHCDLVEPRWSLLIGQHHIDNLFHLHNDNLLPHWWNVHSARMVDQPRMALFRRYRGGHGSTRMPWVMIDAMFEDVVDFDLVKGHTTCFRQLRVGTGPLPFYNTLLPRGDVWANVLSSYRQLAFDTFQIPSAAKHVGQRKVVYIKRAHDWRGLDVETEQKLLDGIRLLNISVTVCCDWTQLEKNPTQGMPVLLKILREAHALLGVHGAGLTNMLYLEPRSIVVELRHYQPKAVVYPAMSAKLGHTHLDLNIATEEYGRKTGVVLPDPVIDSIVRGTADAIEQEWNKTEENLLDLHKEYPQCYYSFPTTKDLKQFSLGRCYLIRDEALQTIHECFSSGDCDY